MTCPSNDLPFEIVSSITSHLHHQAHLYQCALINKRFYAATIPRLWEEPMSGNDVSHLWDAPVYRGRNRRDSDDMIWDPGFVTCLKLIQCLLTTRQYQQTNAFRSSPLGHYIRKLDIIDQDSAGKSLLLLSHAPFLEHLRLLGLEMTDDDVEIIWQLCPRLKSIHLLDIPFQRLTGIGEHCRHLTSFTLERPKDLWPVAIQHLLGCPLTHIHIIKCRWTCGSAGDISQFQQLESLIIEYCGHLRDGFFTDLVSTANPCPRLKKLELDKASLTPKTALLVMKSLPRLADININLRQKVTDKLLVALASGPSLKDIRRLLTGDPGHRHQLPTKCLDEIRRNTGFRTTPQDDPPNPPPHHRVPSRHQSDDSDSANSATYAGLALLSRYQFDDSESPQYRSDDSESPEYRSDDSESPQYRSDDSESPEYRSDDSESPQYRSDDRDSDESYYWLT
ncbi:hypothetical protein [Absidia glauca]|uniref:F-box domain-containing protein n=1 Tax=Absidia glauca TaxID=4829 RepID=A0A168Q3R2_ABSGL|nr:hypothetical protein [Absidia glauca]